MSMRVKRLYLAPFALLKTSISTVQTHTTVCGYFFANLTCAATKIDSKLFPLDAICYIATPERAWEYSILR